MRKLDMVPAVFVIAASMAVTTSRVAALTFAGETAASSAALIGRGTLWPVASAATAVVSGVTLAVLARAVSTPATTA